MIVLRWSSSASRRMWRDVDAVMPRVLEESGIWPEGILAAGLAE